MEDNVTMSVEKLMFDLADLEAKIAVINMEKTREIERLIPEEFRIVMDEINDQFGSEVKAAEVEVENLREQIKAAVLAIGSSVKGEFYQALFMKGRVKWNNSMLEGYALQNPEVLHARTYDPPTVQIRKLGGK